MEKLENYAEIEAEKAENLGFCRGIKLLHVKNKVAELLSMIGRNNFFQEYTIHDIRHVDEMLKITEWLIPERTKKVMSQAEWMMLTLAIYLHDLGMIVTKKEYENRNKTLFKNYKEKVLDETRQLGYSEFVQNKDDAFLYEEFVRENHAQRVKDWISDNSSIDFGDAEDVRIEIKKTLESLIPMFITDLAMICESHHEDDIDDFNKYKVKKFYGNSKEEKVNLNYIAIILRVADLLHITRDRAPSIARRIINVNNPVSIIEWEKQAAVLAVRPKDKRNENGEVDENREKDTIEITAYFDGVDKAEGYFGLSAYLKYVEAELEKCREITEKAQKTEGATDYIFPWISIDESQIEVVGFEKNKLQFTIAQENILQLLVGHTLYNDSSVVVRELVQNGVDAVRLQIQCDKIDGAQITNGRVQVDWNHERRELTFWDNGTGMSMKDIENYLLKVGASKYRNESFKKQFPNFSSISHFGIGLLTCFMVADDIDIMTSSKEQELANSISLRKVNGNYLLQKIEKNKLDNRIKDHGTMVKLYVRPDVDMESLERDLKKWIVLPEIPVYLTFNDKDESRIGYDNLKDILIKLYMSF